MCPDVHHCVANFFGWFTIFQRGISDELIMQLTSMGPLAVMFFLWIVIRLFVMAASWMATQSACLRYWRLSASTW
jgi:hypothetical protein